MAIDDPIAFAPPPAFGPFRVLHQIGIGALGPVFRTYEPTRDRLVAVKVFRLDITPEQAQVLADELARAADAGLFHPSIVEPIAAGVEGTVAYRAEEYVAAESLDAAIRHYAPAPLETALPFLTQLAGAVDFARTAGIGHGSLHLRDIFVTPEEARASGFGVVEALERVGLRAPVRRPYSAPERVAGEQWSTPADVFSLAAITYELLTGRRPAGTGEQMGAFTGDHLLEYGAGIRLVLARAMHEDPARRYPSALAFASALEAAARGGRVTEAVMAVGEIAGGAAAAPAASIPVVPAAPVPPAAAPGLALAGAAAVDRSDKTADAPHDLPLASHDTEEIAYSDISDERDDDAAHYELGGAHEDEPTLFDEEAAADLGLEPRHEIDHHTVAPPAPSRLWEDESVTTRSGTPSRLSQERNTGRYDSSIDTGSAAYAADDSETASDDERPRPAVLPIAVTLILGLLIGFAAGYWAGGREPDARSRVAATPAAPTPAPSEPARNPAPSGSPKGAGQAYSEQTVQPPTTPPAVPDEGPRTPSTTKTPAAERARPSAPPVTNGRMMVTSTPSRASVTVNGRWRGRTPLTVDGLKFGEYNVRVVLPGFTVGREDLTLSASEPSRNVALRLQREVAAAPPQPAPARPRPRPGTSVRDAAEPPARPALGTPFTGSVYVDSRPRGARIVIDGKVVGTTPARIPEVTIGSHVVRLELADHRVWTVATRVAAGEETRVTGSLERIP